MTLDRKTRWLVGFQISGVITKCHPFGQIQTIQTGWWFQIFFIFTPILWGNDPIWRLHIFQMGGSTNHQLAKLWWFWMDFTGKISGDSLGWYSIPKEKGPKAPLFPQSFDIGWSRLLPQQAWIFFRFMDGLWYAWVDINRRYQSNPSWNSH